MSLAERASPPQYSTGGHNLHVSEIPTSVFLGGEERPRKRQGSRRQINWQANDNGGWSLAARPRGTVSEVGLQKAAEEFTSRSEWF